MSFIRVRQLRNVIRTLYQILARNQFFGAGRDLREVGSKVIERHRIRNQIQKYYDEHKDEFTLPETVRIREILVSTTENPNRRAKPGKRGISFASGVLNNARTSVRWPSIFSDGGTAHQAANWIVPSAESWIRRSNRSIQAEPEMK